MESRKSIENLNLYEINYIESIIKDIMSIQLLSINKSQIIISIIDCMCDKIKLIEGGGSCLKVEINDEWVEDYHNHIFDNIYELLIKPDSGKRSYNIGKFISDIFPYAPSYIDQRMRQQHACFTIHGGKYINGSNYIKVVNMEDVTEASSYNLLKIRIPARAKKSLLKDLKYAGIHEATLFPEMDRQVNSIKEMAAFAPPSEKQG